MLIPQPILGSLNIFICTYDEWKQYKFCGEGDRASEMSDEGGAWTVVMVRMTDALLEAKTLVGSIKPDRVGGFNEGVTRMRADEAGQSNEIGTTSMMEKRMEGRSASGTYKTENMYS